MGLRTKNGTGGELFEIAGVFKERAILALSNEE